MESTPTIRLARLVEPQPSPRARVVDRRVDAPVRLAVFSARQWLLDQQRGDRLWCGRQEGDASLTARLLLLSIARGQTADERLEHLTRIVERSQLPSGGWSARPGTPADLSVSVLCYLALKRRRGAEALAALDNARRVILEQGGAACCDDETTAWLALLGELPHAVPMQHRPQRFVADAVDAAATPTPSPLHGVRELFTTESPAREPESDVPPLAEPYRCLAGRLLWRLATLGDACCQESERLEAELQTLFDDETGLMPDQAPLADTAQALHALRQSGLEVCSGVSEAVDRLVTKADVGIGLAAAPSEVAPVVRSLAGLEQLPSNEPGELPPVLQLMAGDDEPGATGGAAINHGAVLALRDRLVRQLVAKQNPDGSWSAGGGACCVATAEVVLALTARGSGAPKTVIGSAIDWLRRRQAIDGSWEDQPATPHGLATTRAMMALAAGGAGQSDTAVLAAANWLFAEQHESGGWGETINASGRTLVTATQTARAVESLSAVGFGAHPATSRGVDFLLGTQGDDGGWLEPHFASPGAGTGRCYRNHLGATIASLTALALWSTIAPAKSRDRPAICLRLADHGPVDAV